jgi:alkyl hydroperoxide reductase subunit AhpC
VPAFDSNREKMAALDAQVVDISVDSILSHQAWQEKEIGDVKLPLCSDFYPHGEVTQKYGILREGPPVPGICERAAFIVDKKGKIAFAKVYPLDQLPNIGELLRVLEQMNK